MPVRPEGLEKHLLHAAGSSACHSTCIPAPLGSSIKTAGWDQPWAFLVPVTVSHLNKSSLKVVLPLLRFHITVLSSLFGGPVHLARWLPVNPKTASRALIICVPWIAVAPLLDKLCIPNSETSNQAKTSAWNSLKWELCDSSQQLRNSLFG